MDPLSSRAAPNAGGVAGGGAGKGPQILSLRTLADPALQAQVDSRIRQLAQTPGRGNRGFEIAAALYAVTGKRDLLEDAIRCADALHEEFTLRHPPFSGGERDAINCVQLYRATHDRRHLDLARHYLDIRGLEDSVNRSRHNQSYKPVLEQDEAVGHAVNCASLMVSLVDVGVLTGIKDYFDAGHRMWQDAVTSKMYIIGGIGSTGNEGFGEPYSLPNISAYAETCAGLMFITLNHRLFMATGDSKYIDVMERGMYNNAIDGVSASGNRFFYVNRLASAGDGRDLRWERASLECCPPNLVRFLASMPGFIYAQDGNDAIYGAEYSLNGLRGWFLPSRDELALMYRNLKARGACSFEAGGVSDNFNYWTSSQQSADMAAHIDFADSGRQHGDDKDFPRRVRAIRAF